jgi:HEAT repeat protein
VIRRVALLALCSIPMAGCRGDRLRHALTGPPRAVRPLAEPTEQGLEGLVAVLATGDFVARNRAAEALVTAGEPALPALGRAGTLEVAVHAGIAVSATRPVLREILAQAPEDRLAQVHLASPWPVVRVTAAEEIGRRRAWPAVPALIARLEDAEPAVRRAAAAALRRVTNRVEGGVGATPESGRLAAAEWREWWHRVGRSAPVAATPPSDG